ncbi:MAG: 4Fe-4S dicluster domain-containing protein, partial [Phycisphaerae bacterium]
WAYVVDASTGTIASPGTRPSAVIVSVVNLDNHVVRGDAILSAEQERFLKGIARIRSLFPDTPMHFAIPQPDSELSRRLIAELPSDGSVSLLRVPMRYGLDKPAILARMAGCKPSREPVWFIRAEGVVAIENALESRRPVTRRISAIGGPGANAPRHIDVLLGHPVDLLVKPSPDYRIIRGGVMQGEIITSGTGVAIGTQGLTVLPHLQERKLLGFARPGWRTRSCSRWFLSALRRWFPEDHTTGLRGERRACVACGLCRKVCPAGLWPQWIHKALFSGDVAEAQLLGLDLCVGCGLCTYACPAKLELSRDFRDGQDGAAKEASSTGAIS